MPYHDNEYKPESLKKTTEKKEELIVSPNFISTPEQNTQQQAIEKAVAESMKIKPEVLSSKRSAFLNKGRKGSGGGSVDCSDNCGIILSGQFVSNNVVHSGFFHYDHSSNSYTQFSGATGIRNDVARWDDKLYSIEEQINSNLPHQFIEEWQINSNCSVTWLRDIPIHNYTGLSIYAFGAIQPSGGYINVGNSMDMKDANTIICGGVAELGQGLGNMRHLIEIDISGPVGIATYLFPAAYMTPVDLIYMQDTSEVLVTLNPLPSQTPPPKKINLYSYSGSLLDTTTHTAGGLGLYRIPSGDIFVSGINSGTGTHSGIHPVTFNSLAVGSSIQYSGIDIRGAAYNSNPNTTCGTPSGGCYNIGDIGPEGGIIFSVPGVGLNTSTNMYYEAALKDIATGGVDPAVFNTTCGIPYINQVGNAGVFAIILISDTQILIDPTNPQNVGFPFSDLMPGMTVNGFGPTSIYPNPTGVAGVGATIVSINTNVSAYGLTGLIEIYVDTPAIAGYNPPNQNNAIVFWELVFPPGFSTLGAEWGLYEDTTINWQAVTLFGSGQTNTDAIDSYPTGLGTAPPNPTIDTHDIAATICKQHGTTHDWFLPSLEEFIEMMGTVGPGTTFATTLDLNTQTNLSQNMYWTSSQFIPHTPPVLPDPEKYSWAHDVVNNTPTLSHRCQTLSVRPIRRFECEPCTGCDCVEYNWRDGNCGRVDGSLCGGSGITLNPVLAAPSIDWETTNGGTTPGQLSPPNIHDSVMGGQEMNISSINKWDVLGNEYNYSDIMNSASGFKITLWDVNYNFMGKWKYDLMSPPVYQLGSLDRPTPTNPWSNPLVGNRMLLKFQNGVHLEGDYPVIWYGANGSSTGVFFKIEWDGNSGSYETGCNSTIFGNPHPYNTPGHNEDHAFYCGPLYNPYNGSFTGLYRTIPRYATNQPIDLNGVALPVYPTALLANPNYNTAQWPPDGHFSNVLSSGECADCEYDIGDIGPAGGIIVATPNMGLGTVTPYGADENLTNFYYELSPGDIHQSIPPTVIDHEWGNWSSSSPINLNGVVQNLIDVGEGEQNTIDLMTTSPGLNQWNPMSGTPLPLVAVELCDNYSLNGYDDWFLPNVLEWWFARNNISSISTAPDPEDNLYWTSNFWPDGPYFSDEYEQYGVGPGNITFIPSAFPGPLGILGNNETALVTDVNTTVTYDPLTSTVPPLPGSGLTLAPGVSSASQLPRWNMAKVRPMRKFDCQPPPIVGCMDPQASNYNPSAVINSGCIYENHCFSMCAGFYDPNPAIPGDEYWISFANTPWAPGQSWGPLHLNYYGPGNFNPPGYTPVNSDFTAFYNWLITQIPSLTVGDSFQMIWYNPYSLTFPWLNVGSNTTPEFDRICFKYRGIQTFQTSISILNNPPNITPQVPDIITSVCCGYGGTSNAKIGRPTEPTRIQAIKADISPSVFDFEGGDITNTRANKIYNK